jgi:hypothetical protein
MRKRLATVVATLVGLFVLLLLALWWAAGSEQPARVLEAGAEERGSADRRALAPGGEGQGPAEPGSTPLLGQAATEAQGLLEVEALHQERRVPGALVRLYLRGERDPNLNEIGWRLAGTAVTDAEGRARLPSAPGAYLLAVRASGLAPLLLDLVRPLNEEHTRVQVRLEPGYVLAGHTRLLGSAQPLEELTAGSWKLEARAPGHGRVRRHLQPCRIRGRVVDATTRAPVVGATIYADEALDDASPASTDEQGFFAMQGVLPGEQALSIFGGGGGYARRKVLLRAGEDRDLGEIELTRE